MLSLKKLIVNALVAEVKITDAILIAADNAVNENSKLDDKIKSDSNKTEVSK